jgi:hypothetical protein
VDSLTITDVPGEIRITTADGESFTAAFGTLSREPTKPVQADVAYAPEPVPEHVPEPEPEPNQEPVAPPPAEIENTPPPGTGAVEGTLTGACSSAVIWVRLLGPNNLLIEAERIRPDADGRWSCSGLEPGSYRVVLDAGGDRVVFSHPPFRMVKVDAGRKTVARSLEVLDVR